MKNLIILLFLCCTSFLKAEHFFSFHLMEIDFSDYPTIRIKGGALEIGDDINEEATYINFKENGEEKNISIKYNRIQDNFLSFTITYKTNLPKLSNREFYLNYDDNGFHNGNQQYEYRSNQHYRIKSVFNDNINDEYVVYIENLLDNYSRNKKQDMYILALNGLLVREQPSNKSEIIGKFDFGSKVTVSLKQYGERISITENKDINLKINGRFREVKFGNKKGYIFEGYLTSFSFFRESNQCSSIYENVKNESSSQAYRLDISEDENGQFLKIKNIDLEKTHLIAQALFRSFDTLVIKKGKSKVHLFNGFDYHIFKNSDYSFKILKESNTTFSFFCYYKIYFKCDS